MTFERLALIAAVILPLAACVIYIASKVVEYFGFVSAVLNLPFP